MAQQQQAQGIVTPHDHDVLAGRGNFVNYHAGNEHFRALVRKHKVAYVACPKPQKGKFSKMIVDEIQSLNPPGRFLKQDPVTKLWHDIGEKKSLDKTRQALREGAPEIMKDLTYDDEVEGHEQQLEETLSPVRSYKPSTQLPTSNDTQSTTPKSTLACNPNQFANYINSGSSSQNTNINSSTNHQYDCFSSNAQAAVALNLSLQNDVSPSDLLHSHQTVIVNSGNLPQHHATHGFMNPPLPQQPNALRHHLTDPSGFSHPISVALLQQQQQQRILINQQFSPQNAGGFGIQRPLTNEASSPGVGFHSFLPKHLQQINRAPFLTDELEPRPIAPNVEKQLSFHQHNSNQRLQPQSQEDNGESERVAPLPARKSLSQLSKLGKRGELKRDGSENSLKIDSLFVGIDNYKQGTGNTALGAHIGSTKNSNNQNYGSSAHISLMSLSLGDMALNVNEPAVSQTEQDDHHQQEHQQQQMPQQQQQPVQQNPAIAKSEQLPMRFNNSLRFGKHVQKTSMKRSGSGVETSASSESVGHVMDMSVATLGFSEVGEMSIARMSESQANMSFSNIFEDTDREVDPNQIKPV